MRRREFFVVLCGAVTAWSLPLRARKAMPVVGFLHPSSARTFARQLAAFQQGLKEGGFVEGRDIRIEYRWANGRFDQLPALATDLVRRRVSVIAAVGGAKSALAAKAASAEIPIVFSSGADAVKTGLVSSLSRPGGNVTGISFLVVNLLAKQLGLLHQLIPRATTVALLVNPSGPEGQRERTEATLAARKLGVELKVLNASSAPEIDRAFATLTQTSADALVVGASPFFGNTDRIKQIVREAAIHRIPAMYYRRAFVAAGGLMSYGTSITDAYRQAGLYVTRILKGAKPADLPVLRPSKFNFVINLKTAKALGLKIHPQWLAIATEVID